MDHPGTETPPGGVTAAPVFRLLDGRPESGPYLVPDLPPYFVPRHELNAIKELLLGRPTGALAPLTLFGPPGAGKTSLAIALAHDADVLAAFPDGVLWYSLSEGADVVQHAQTVWGRALGLELGQVPDSTGRAAALRTLLRESRALLIIDDVTDTEQIKALNVGGPNCVRLITTDRGTEITYAFKTRRYQIGRMSEEESLGLLINWAGMLPDIYRSTVTEIVARLCYSPLSLSLVGAQARQGITWLRLLEVLQDDQGPLAAHDPDDLSTRDHALHLILNIALSRFGGAQLQRAIALGAFAGGMGAPFSVEAAAACWEMDPGEARSTLEALVQAAFVQRLPGGYYALHAALRQHLRQIARPGIIESAEERIREHYIRLMEFAGSSRYSAQIDAQLNQVMSAYRYLAEHQPEPALVFADALLIYFEERRLWGSLAQVAQEAVTASRAAGDIEREATALDDLGFAQSSMGRLQDALLTFTDSLELSRTIGDPLREATALNNMGAVFERQGQYAEALAHYEDSLALQESMGIRENVAEALNNVAGVLYWLERWDDAIRNFQRALDMYDQMADRSGQAQTWLNIGAVYERMGRDDEAEQAYQRSLAIYTNLGDESGQSQALNNLGIIYFNMGDSESALANFKRSLAIKERLGDRYGEALTLNNIALLYEKTGSTTLALDHYERSYTLLNALGDPRTELVQENINTLRAQMGA
jgi:tetratricopeptide (TPR) repeat protein